MGGKQGCSVGVAVRWQGSPQRRTTMPCVAVVRPCTISRIAGCAMPNTAASKRREWPRNARAAQRLEISPVRRNRFLTELEHNLRATVLLRLKSLDSTVFSPSKTLSSGRHLAFTTWATEITVAQTVISVAQTVISVARIVAREAFSGLSKRLSASIYPERKCQDYLPKSIHFQRSVQLSRG